MGVPLTTWFSTVQFQFFFQPFALDSADPTTLYLYASSGAGSKAPLKAAGIYKLTVPHDVTKPSDVGPPTLAHATGDVYVLLAGGKTAGKPDSSVLVAINDTALLHRSAASRGQLVARPLPARFARPITFEYVKDASGDFQYVLGPTSHDRTVSLAVSPEDSRLVAVTGWTSLVDGRSAERIWLTADAGESYMEVTGNLRDATKASGPMRPSALLLVALAKETTALLVGTTTGVYVAFIRPRTGVSAMESGAAAMNVGTWTRLGGCAELPLVMVAGLSYEPKDDTVVAATMGRGVYIVHEAKRTLAALAALYTL